MDKFLGDFLGLMERGVVALEQIASSIGYRGVEVDKLPKKSAPIPSEYDVEPSPDDAPVKKKGRPRKVVEEAPVEEAVEAAPVEKTAPVEEGFFEPDDAPATTFTVDDVKAAVTAAQAACPIDDVKATFLANSFGAPKISALDPAHYAGVIAAMNALIKK